MHAVTYIMQYLNTHIYLYIAIQGVIQDKSHQKMLLKKANCYRIEGNFRGAKYSWFSWLKV